MKVGVCEATELKKRSEMLSIPFADLLWGYAVEDLMLRVSTSCLLYTSPSPRDA